MMPLSQMAFRWLATLAFAAMLGLSGCAHRHATKAPVNPDAATVDAPAAGSSPTAALDPWEGFNRRTHRFNMGLDHYFLKPAAQAYTRFTPRLLRLGISHVFDNLQQPITSINLLLQGRPGKAGASFGRFLLNSTLGVAGIFDPATDAGIPTYNADLGQTLGVWGWRESRYLVIPFFGPGTVRDGLGRGISTRYSLVSEAASEYGVGVSFLYGLDARAGVLAYDDMLKDAEDDYLLLRDTYLQRRRCQIVDCSEELPDYLMPDYDYEIPNIELGK